MAKTFKGKKIVAEDDVWDLIKENSVFKQFVEFCLSRFFEVGEVEDDYPIPDDIEDTFSERLYFIRDESNDTVRISLNGDGYGERL